MCVHTHGCIINSMQFYHMYVHITTTTVKIQNCFMITRTIPAPCWHSCSSSLSISRTPAAAAAKSLQSCPTLCDPIDLPGSPVPGILQARTLEWVAICLVKFYCTLEQKSTGCKRSGLIPFLHLLSVILGKSPEFSTFSPAK